MCNYTILFNPHAGNGRGEENALSIRNILPGENLTFYDMTQITSYPDFFSALPPENAIVICGGDGTLNRFLNDIGELPLQDRLFYYPGGSGNDFLRDVAQGESKHLIRLKEYINSLPTVTVNGKTYHFLNGIGYGIDGYCCQVGDALREDSARKVNYTAIAVKGLLFHYVPTNATVTVDGQRHSYRKVWLAPTMNGRFYGGGMMPTPQQNRLNPDGTVSVMVMYGTGKLKTLTVFPSIFEGGHTKHREMVEVLSGHEICVEFDRPTPLQIDGETIRNVAKYEVTGRTCAAASRQPEEAVH